LPHIGNYTVKVLIQHIAFFILTIVAGGKLYSQTVVTESKSEKVITRTIPKTAVLLPKSNSEDFLHKYLLTPVSKSSTGTPNASSQKTLSTTSKTTVSKAEPSVAEEMVSWLKKKYSLMMDVMPDQIKNVMMYRFIDAWYGVRYRLGGTTKKGIDCSAFVQQLYKYAFGTDLVRTACSQFQSASYIKNKMDLKEGDLVFFSIGTSRISHVGVYLNNNYFVHSASSKGVSIANLTNSYWARYFVGGGRILGKED
jgi:cell wall-associated NlpC family hydrolase